MKALLLSLPLLLLCCACNRHTKEEVAPFNSHYGLQTPEEHPPGPEHANPVQEKSATPAETPGGH